MDEMSEFLESLEAVQGGTLEKKSSDVKNWVKTVFFHIKALISPLVSTDVRCSSSDIAKRLLCSVRKQGKMSTQCFPIRKDCTTISRLKTVNRAVESKLIEEDYDASARHILENDSPSMDFCCSDSSDRFNSLLIGKLCDDGSMRQHLYISDSSGRIPCHITAARPKYLNAIVFLPQWRYIPPCGSESNQFRGYIEVISQPIVLSDSQKAKESIKKVSLQGIVLSVSSCLQMKNWTFAVHLRLLPGKEIKVILFLKKFTFWFSCLLRGNHVQFEGLRKSVLKRKDKNHDIYTLGDDSILTILDSVLPKDFTLSKQQFLKEICNKLSSVCRADKKWCRGRICSEYIGEVTKVLNKQLALFSLDEGKVILHCLYRLFPDFGCAIRRGALLLITHCHFYKHSDGIIHLVACSRSNIAVIRHSENLSCWEMITNLGNPIVKNYLLKEQFLHHPVQMMSLVKFLNELCSRFTFLSMEKLMPFFLSNHESNGSVILNQLLMKKQVADGTDLITERIDEVFSDPHCCIATEVLKENWSSYYLMPIQELLQRAQTHTNAEYYRQKLEEYWMQRVFNDSVFKPKKTMKWDNDLFLLGIFGSVNGRLAICDTTAAIECVIVREDNSGDNISRPCVKDKGCLVRIKKFFIIAECTIKQHTPIVVSCSADVPSTSELFNKTFDLPELAIHTYIICYWKDVDILCGRSEVAQSNMQNYKDAKRENYYKADPSIARETVFVTDVNVKRSFVLFVTDISQVNLCSFFAQGYLLKAEFDNVKTSVLSILLLNFFDSSWRPYIFPGMVLKIVKTVKSEVEDVASTFKSLDITPECTIEQVDLCQCGKDMLELVEVAKRKWSGSYLGKSWSKVYTVDEVLQNPPSELVSLRGIVCHQKTFMEGDELKQRLELSDTEHSINRTLSLYLGAINSINGLVKGSTVILQKIRIYKSFKGNVYCKYDGRCDIVMESIYEQGFTKACEDCTDLEQYISNESNPGESARITPDDASSIVDEASLETAYIAELVACTERLFACQKRKIFKMNVCPIKILKVSISYNDDEIKGTPRLYFSAKCIATDLTGRSYLYFDTCTLADFFSFIDIPTDILEQYLRICKTSANLKIEYNSTLHCDDNLWMDRSMNNYSGSAAHILVTICNRANCTVFPMKDVALRHKNFSCSDLSPFCTKGSSSVGTDGEDQLLTFHLNLLHFDCLRILSS